MPTDLTPELRSAIDRFTALDRVLVATDFDGVLAPLVDDPADSRPIDGSVALLERLARAGTPAALVSGRDLASLRAAAGVEPASPVILIGSHGAESSVELDLGATLDDRARQRLADTVEVLTRIAEQHQPVRLEHKPAGIVLHTRGVAPEVAEPATSAALRVPEEVAGVHAMRGKDVVELSVLPVSKGQALQALSRDLGVAATLYQGDDVTDETAFAALRDDERNVTVKVGPGETLAGFRVAGPPDAVATLRAVADRRTAG